MTDLVRPTEDDWEAWRANPVTRWVLSGVQRFADAQAEDFAAMWSSPAGTPIDQQRVDRLKVRADAYHGLANLTFGQAVGLHPETTPPEETNG